MSRAEKEKSPEGEGFYIPKLENNGTTWSSSTSFTSTSGTVSGLTENTNYVFQVRATLATNQNYSSWSPTVSFPSARTLLATPTNLRCTTQTVDSISLAWNTVSGTIGGYEIQYRESGTTTWLPATPISTSGTSATISVPTATKQYQFQVRALNSTYGNNSTWATLSATPLTAPTLGTVIATGTDTISVAWNAIINASGYRVEYSTSSTFPASGLGTKVIDSQSTTSTEITGLNVNTLYYVRVIAIGTGAFSNSSSSTSKSTATLCNPPTDLISTSQTTTSISLSWSAPATGTVSSYRVERSANGTDGWTLAGTTTSTTRTYNDTGRTANTTYYYRVSAVNSSSVLSATAVTGDFTTLCTAPTGLTSPSRTATSIELSWNAPTSGATSYMLERSANGTSGCRSERFSIF